MSHFDFVRPCTVAQWTFDQGNGDDTGPYGYDLNDSGSPPAHPSGRFGLGSRYYGHNYMVGDDYFTQLALYNMSASFWMRCNTYALQSIFGYVYSLSNIAGYVIGVTSLGQLSFDTSDGDYWYTVTGGSNVMGNVWNWIVITRDDTHTRFYINGKLDYSEENLPLGFDGREWTCIGAYWDMYSWADYDNYIGYLDELHIYDIELSPETIRKLYAFQMGWL